MKSQPVTLLHCAAIRDAAETNERDATIAVSGGRIAYAGKRMECPQELKAHVVRELEYPDYVVTPAHVSAHTHLDLSHVGPQPYEGDFMEWLKSVREVRAAKHTPVEEAVTQGVRLSRDGGVGYVADIAGSVEAITARRELARLMPLPGVSYLEWFGIGGFDAEAAKNLKEKMRQVAYETPVVGHTRGIVVGIQPHAPYSAGKQVYQTAAKLSRQRAYRLSTHLAESKEEIEFVEEGKGLFVKMLQAVGKWDETILPQKMHPADYLEKELKQGRWLLAHCNYLLDHHMDMLREAGCSVAYCPIASDYFGHRGHRYRELLEAGVNVALGIDSIICQPRDEEQPMGILPQMRYLYHRDGVSAGLLLRMATVNGMLAMDLPEDDATLNEGAPALFTAMKIKASDMTDPMVQVMENEEVARLVDLTREL